METPSDNNLLLWEPSLEMKQQANITCYLQWLEQAKGLHFQTREELWQWSVTHLEDFWTSIWDFFHIQASQPYKTVLTTHTMPGASWFPEAKLNYAEHIFRNSSDQRPALLFRSEHHPLREVSWDELRQKVSAVTKALQAMGVQRGDRVVAYMPNIPETIIAFLACASMGAIWSSCSPDFGTSSTIDRFKQIEPKVLFAVDGYQYGGQSFDRRHIIAALQQALPSLQKTVLVPYLQKQFELGPLTNTISWQETIAQPGELVFEQVPFDHPLWVLYSSGTTGLPKAIVQGHGGILLEHLKNLSLEVDLKPGDRFFWFTTTGWMMWNFLVSGLLVEATLLLYDGSPAYPDLHTLWQFAQDTEMTFFGTSATYISSCMKFDIEPGKQFDLHKLQGIGSTGSPLPPEGFLWLYEHVKEDLWLASMSGGTDVCSAFVNGSILLPVHTGELQCRSLGAKIEAFDEQGHALIDEVGELVITEPLPSMPLFFWNDPAHQRYQESYFSLYPGIWRHGDWIKITPRGSAIIYGRSDSTINRAGIRIGTSEIYRIIESLPEVLDSLVVGVELPHGRYYMPLFVVLREGVELDDALKAKINGKLRTTISPYHVPDEILTIPEVPRTLNGKKLEVPIKKLLMGVPIEKSGIPIEWTVLYEGERRMRFPLPTYPFERQQLWVDPLLQELSSTGSLLQARVGKEQQSVDLNDKLAPITPSSSLHPRVPLLTAYVAPTNETERTICAIWQQLLGIRSVGIHDSFFELGGHSLLVINFITDLYKAVQIRISMQDILKAPTVAELAVLIEAMKGNEVRQNLSALSQTSQREGEPNHPTPFPMIVPDPSQQNAPYPLTDLQQAYWIGQTNLFELGNIFAHIYIEIEFPHLDLSRLNHAIQCLVEHHNTLRSVVLPDGQQQVLVNVPLYQIPVTDLCGQDKQVVTSQLAATRAYMSQHGPSTSEWPLWEIHASLLDHQHVRLHVSFCLILLDARSQTTLIKELVQLYQDPHASLLPLKLTCRDYILALQDLEHTPLYQQSYTYWMQRLATLPPAPELPLLKRPGNVKETRFVTRSRQLDAPTWQRLKALAARQGLTPNAILYTAYAKVLATWSKTAHFTINMLFFNRFPMHPQVDDLIGNLSTTLLLEVNLTEPSSFATHAQRLQQQLWNDLAHSSISGVRVIREVAKMQGWTSQALMPVTFSSGLNIGVMPLPESEEQWSVEYHSLQTPQVYLDHWVQEERSGGLVLWWYMVDEVFPEDMPAEMLDAYYHLLQSLANDEALWLQSSRHLVPSHQIARYETMNTTDAPISTELLHTLAMQHIERQPSQKAVVTSGRTLTYAQLHRMANQVGSWLRQRGVCPNSLVAVVMEKGWEQVVAMLGILYAGAAYLPIDPTLPRERLWYVLEDGAVQQVLTQRRVNDRLEWPKEIQCLCVDDEHINELSVRPLAPAQQEDLAYVIYTSGSTGVPKGVMIDHRGAVNTVLDINKRFNVGPEDRILALSSLGFDLSVYDIFGVLGAGGVIILPDAEASRDPTHLAQLLNQEQVTIWNSAPAFMELLIEYLASRAEQLPSSLRLVLLSGDWIPVCLPGKIKALGKDIQVVSLGGATEASIWSILYPIETMRDDWKSIPYGRPMQNQHVYVLDANLNHRATWVPGHLYIGGIGLARGYWHDEAKTNASFIEHPHTHERLYQTGDLGRYLPDGTIEFLGREDFQVKVQGYRIELGEIEETLKQYAGVSEVIATVEKTAGQGEKCLVAYVVFHNRQKLDPDELRAFAKTKLPAYMVPLVIVPIDAVPLTPNGKVDRKALPKWDEARSAQQKISLASRDALEQQLVNLWETILERHPIGVTDNFFELGGNSLGALRLMERIRKQFGQELPLSILFEGATIDQLASILRRPSIQSVRQQSPLVAIQPNGLKPPFFCVHSVGGNVLCYAELSRQLGEEQPFYALQALGLEGEVPPSTSLEEMAACYRGLIEAVQPRGPYLLGGWSMGSMVAFEMAQQWRQEGKEVALLALLDNVPQNGKDGMLLDDVDLLAWFAKDLGGSSGKSLTLVSDDLQKLGPDEQLSFILEQAQRAQVLPPEAGISYLYRLVRVFKANAQALTSYVPLAYPHQTVLLPTHETLADYASDETLGWGKLIGNALEVYPVSGNHYTMLTQPHIQQLAERLTWCIEMGKAVPR